MGIEGIGIKASMIYVENSDTGIANENDWDKMVKYHAE